MTRNQRMTLGALILLLLGSTPATVPAILDHLTPEYVPPAQREWVVRPGESLWRIAEASYPQSVDPRNAVRAIREANRLRIATIWPGQRLRLPEVR